MMSIAFPLAEREGPIAQVFDPAALLAVVLDHATDASLPGLSNAFRRP